MVPSYYKPIWLGIHNLKNSEEYITIHGERSFENWKEKDNAKNMAASITDGQSKWTSVQVEEKQNFMCIYNIRFNECDKIHNLCDEVNANCIDTIDSYTCTCHDGFETKDGGRTCININECSPDFTENRCGPNTECIDLEPGYTCECSSGFAGSPNDKIIGCSKCDDGYITSKDWIGDGSTCKGKL